MKASPFTRLLYLATVVQFTRLATAAAVFDATAADQFGNWSESAADAAPLTSFQGTRELADQSESGSAAPAACRTITQQPGEYCQALAQRCGVSLTDFQKFNPPANFCNNLQEGQMVCCNEGGIPKPKKGPDGGCAVYKILKGEGCGKIAGQNGITVQELDKFNKATWGWPTCANPTKIYPNFMVCVSDGEPPFPASQEGASCGPTKPGTTRPPRNSLLSKSKDWGKINPCPLNACCNNWGNCGITDDFCKEASLGAPGTTSRQHGCVGNCGMDIINNRETPKEFRHVGYFEAWNLGRKCLHMDVTEIPKEQYTHIHFSFPEITKDYKVNVGKLQDQFDKFIRIKGGPKKIVAFGGWAFSTDLATHAIFRQGITESNGQTLSSNLADFIIKNNLDGIDFDWEYPSVPDMDWLPKSDSKEASNYLQFLRLMRTKLPADKSISIAAPASYWYLKQFPIAEMAKHLDYIVFMTYDLHGQWDWGKEWAIPNCLNCMRSHVDMSETHTALALITKAGVPSHKITVGISSYGRQFQMADPSCTGEKCKFTAGPKGESLATRGRCTDTPDYLSNAEIKEIIKNHPGAKVIDHGDNSKILTYDRNWVSYMDDADKEKRTQLYKSLNFGGVIEWAIDLNTFDKADPSSTIGGGQSGGGTCNANEFQTRFVDTQKQQNRQQALAATRNTLAPSRKPTTRVQRTASLGNTTAFLPAGNDTARVQRMVSLGNTTVLQPARNATQAGEELMLKIVDWITIVNLTPYRFKKTSQHSCQFDEFNFDDIEPGRARRNAMVPTTDVRKNKKDINGEAYYEIEGTNKKFVIRGTTHIPNKYDRRTVVDLRGMGLGQREYRNPNDGTTVNLIITGSESFGYISSIRDTDANWMSKLSKVIGERELRHVIMPGSHDSGMSTLSIGPSGWYGMAQVENTQTQAMPIYDQLVSGIRYFDLRIVSVNKGSFWTAHVTDELAGGPMGATGESLDEIISSINDFYDRYPGEVVILWIRYMTNLDNRVLTTGNRKWDKGMVNKFYDKLEGIRYRCPNIQDASAFEQREAKFFMDMNGGKGCVLPMINGKIGEDLPQERTETGIYNGPLRMNRVDAWADKEDPGQTADFGIAEFKKRARNGDANDKFHIMQWQVTFSTATSIGTTIIPFKSLENVAILDTNPWMYWKTMNAMTPDYWPTVLMQDYVGFLIPGDGEVGSELVVYAIGLNLYLVSLNCKVSKIRHPLADPNHRLAATLDADYVTAFASESIAPFFNGTIFANGTVDEHSAPDFQFNEAIPFADCK